MCSYLNLPGHASLQGKGVAVNVELQKAGHGLRALGQTLVGHREVEVGQGLVELAHLRQEVGAAPSVVEVRAIEGVVVQVPRYGAGARGERVAAPDTLDHLTHLIATTPDLLALHRAPLLAHTTFATLPTRVEDLAQTVVNAPVKATALSERHTVLPTQDKAIVTLAPLGTRGVAAVRIGEGATGQRAGGATRFIMTVQGARHGWAEREREGASGNTPTPH
ncbi:hypothetical protein chiPu_0030502 [Chiloscyllium punctatum]|uniref:Uncharacterized protein n=1 Tax=Chiloscyllium punctatum TaxID=137246 RepID=A0A401TU69_CHIPU|nr:hypothetical protein [Chiloscyllium punctatum]